VTTRSKSANIAAQPPDLANLVQAIINAANANTAAVTPPVAPVPPPLAPYALVPGDAFNTHLDYSSANGMKIFRSAARGMDDKFDRKDDHLRVFLENFKEHVQTYNWNDVVAVPDGAAVNPANQNLVTQYGQVTFEQINAHAAVYLAAQNRTTQNSILLYKYLLNSLMEKANLIMVTLSDQYHANGLPIGALYLKSIIGSSSVGTRAKALLLCESISHLYMKMLELKVNVCLVNKHVSDLVSA
jgi:hypothetical protein